jgi:hypothetical protein
VARITHGRSAGILVGITLACLVLGPSHPAVAAAAPRPPSLLIIVGAAGEEEFGRNFATWAGSWEKAAAQAGASFASIGVTTNQPGDDRDRLRQALGVQATNDASELWVVLLGHGTFDGKEARFNLRGPDFSASEFSEWLKPFTKPLAFVDASSSSGPFLNKLSAAGRVIITATRSGHEANYARFGEHLSQSIVDPAADLDKDGQTSLLEAFLMASRRTAEFYKAEGRLATEHPLIDDNGDGLGTPPDWFRGVRAVKAAKDKAPLDGLRAHQFHLLHNEEDRQLSPEMLARRDALEVSIGRLRDAKKELDEETYYAKLEALLLDLARIYEKSSTNSGTPPARP